MKSTTFTVVALLLGKSLNSVSVPQVEVIRDFIKLRLSFKHTSLLSRKNISKQLTALPQEANGATFVRSIRPYRGSLRRESKGEDQSCHTHNFFI
jgi:hypothetical protein